MAQRALFLVIDSGPMPAVPQSRSGPLTVSPKSRQCLCHKAFFEALRGAGHVVRAYGSDWSLPFPNGVPPLVAARKLLLSEPWDVFALWLPVADEQELARFLAPLTPDIAVCVVLLNESRWLLRTLNGGHAALPPQFVEDVLPTLLKVLEIPAPPALPGRALDLNLASKPAGYTPEEERDIQKRLEDLGYL